MTTSIRHPGPRTKTSLIRRRIRRRRPHRLPRSLPTVPPTEMAAETATADSKAGTEAAETTADKAGMGAIGATAPQEASVAAAAGGPVRACRPRRPGCSLAQQGRLRKRRVSKDAPHIAPRAFLPMWIRWREACDPSKLVTRCLSPAGRRRNALSLLSWKDHGRIDQRRWEQHA